MQHKTSYRGSGNPSQDRGVRVLSSARGITFLLVLFLVTHPPDPRPALVVETTTGIDAGVIDRLKQRMLGLGCPNGLLFDADTCVILHDTYISLDLDSLEEDGRVPTDRLLARVRAPGRTIDQRVFD